MSADGRPVRVLIADDDAMLRDIAQATLEQAGFSVTTVASGDAAVAACALELPDIALLDVDMPDGDGYQACANIRALPGGIDVPIVMVTGLDDPQSIDQAYDAGATDFVVKPINWPLLGYRIRYVLRGARTIEDLRLSEQKNAALLKAIPDGIFLVTSAGTVDHAFSPIPTLAGPVPGRASAAFLDLVPPAAHAAGWQALGAALGGRAAAFEFSGGGEGIRHFECRFLPQSAGRALAIVRDVTARKETEAHIHRLAYFDALTGLPNREWIGDYLKRSLVESAGASHSAALLYVDLDQFKRINDTLGHQIGDALLRQVAERLTHALEVPRAGVARTLPVGANADASSVRAELARVGGDEFIIVLTGPLELADAERIATRTLATLAAPFVQHGYELVVTPSIGIAMFPEHGADAEALLKNADGAMYEAKAAGRNQFRVCDSTLSARALKRLSLEMDLRRAFDTGGLEVYYQPKYDARSLRMVGGEALLRWFHPERGQIPTGDFIAVAEETGLISEIGHWTMQQVCRDQAAWRDQGLSLRPIAVNVSGRDFARPESLLRMVQTVGDAALAPSLFEIELTEGILMQDAEAGRRALVALKEFGFALAVDDFGTGYCSLGYLKRFPLDTLKIDRSFVNDIGRDEDDAAIVRAIVALGHSLGLKIVAEGVATAEQLDFLRNEGCDSIQGFLLSPAVAGTVFADLLRSAAPASLIQLDQRKLRVG